MDFKYVLGPIVLQHLFLIILICMTYKYSCLPSQRLQMERTPQKCSSGFVWFSSLLIVLYAVFAYAEADTYYYMDLYEENLKSIGPIHVEPVHQWVMKNLSFDYFSWRFITWGTAVLLMVLTIKRLHLDFKISMFAVALFYLLEISRSREVLGISMFFFAASLFFYPSRKRFWSFLLATFLVVASFYFHRGMFAAIALIVFMPLKLKKWYVYILLAAFPFLVVAVGHVVDYIQMGNLLLQYDSLGIADKAETYANQAASEANFFGQVSNFLQYSPIIFGLCAATKKIVFGHFPVPKYIYTFYMYWFFATYISFLFYFQDSSSFLFSRFLAFGYFPMAVVLSYIYCRCGIRRIDKWTIGLAMFWGQFYFLYHYYQIYKGF